MSCTCQICGREIKANTGLIAHHGYQRPVRGGGWQTASCFGARWRPYEVACDALPPAIEQVKAYVATMELALHTMITTPTDTYDIQTKKFGYPTGEVVTLTRPENFNTAQRPAATRPGTYENHYWYVRAEVEYSITNNKAAMVTLKKRLRAWRAP